MYNRQDRQDYLMRYRPRFSAVGGLTLMTPGELPWTISEFRDHLRLDGTDQDQWLTAILTAATRKTEADTSIALMRSAYRYSIDRPCGTILLPVGPVFSIESIVYLSISGVETTVPIEEYYLDNRSNPARLQNRDTFSWPTLYDVSGSFWVNFVAGHESANDIPQDLRFAVLLLAAHWFENREASTLLNLNQIPLGYDSIVTSHRRVSW